MGKRGKFPDPDIRAGGLPLEPIVEPVTAELHESAILDFQCWLSDCSIDVPLIMLVQCPCLIAQLLVVYGRHLFSTSKSRHWFVLCVTALQRFSPVMRPALKPVWQLITNWMVLEPTEHRRPVPVILAKALIGLGLVTGNRRWAGCTLLAFYGLARIGEVLRSPRQCLLLPADMLFACSDRVFLHYKTPKSRRRGGAFQQHSLVRGEAFAKLLSSIFGELAPTEPLYPMSASTYRSRWNRFLAVLRVPKTFHVLPGGLRGGGAVASYMADVPIPQIMWRMRLKSATTLEHYLQEVAAAVTLRDFPREAVTRVTFFASVFDTAVEKYSNGCC